MLRTLYAELESVSRRIPITLFVHQHALKADAVQDAMQYWSQKGFVVLATSAGNPVELVLTPEGIDYVENQAAQEIAEGPRMQNWRDLGQSLGEGGQGEVRRVEHVTTRQLGALKKVTSKRTDAIPRFFREIEAIRKIKNPFVLPVLDAWAGDNPFFVTEIAALGSLQDHHAAFADDLWRSLRMVRSVALGLNAAHNEGIIHRDVKPNNILLQTLDHPVVSDFGCAHIAEDQHFTTVGQTVGAWFYAPPEWKRTEQNPTAAFDVFSLGGVLHWALSGTEPTTPYRDLPVPPKLGAESVDSLLGRMLAKDATARLQSMQPVVVEIDALLKRLFANRGEMICACGGTFKDLGRLFFKAAAGEIYLQRLGADAHSGMRLSDIAPNLEECSECKTVRMRRNAVG